jgi:predicted metal-dependent hydrolase
MPTADEALAAQFRVELIRSKRRKRSVGAQLHGDLLTVTVPMWMSVAEQQHWIGEMSRRFGRKMSADRIDLRARADVLARRYGLDRPTEIRWVDTMSSRWGSCTPDTGVIRLSSRLAAFPDWVVDYVIVHELAHLRIAGHQPEFWELVHRYPRAERAIGYLIARAGMEDEPDEAPA